jgi:soluble lytic murein transglycosylase-like protein
MQATAGAQTVYECGPPEQPRYSDVRDERNCRAFIVDPGVPAPRSNARRPAFDGVARARWIEPIRAAAARHALPPGLLEALVATESGYRLNAVSPKGAIGLTQLMPETARLLGVHDPREPHANLDGGARYLRMLLDLYAGDVKLALAAYNAGHAAVARYGNTVPPYTETRAYVLRVEAFWRDLGTREAN